MRWLPKILLCFAVLLAGCKLLPHQPITPEGHDLAAGQLIFHSDFELPRDHRLVRELMQERDDICTTLGLPATDEPIHVYLFRNADRYQEYLMRKFPTVPSRRAFFLETDMQLSVYAHWSDRMAEDLRHEVAHGYLHAALPNLPVWVDEGLAEYFEVPRGLGGLNQPHVALLSDSITQDHWKPNLQRLESLTESGQMNQRDYAESWAWVYFMLHSPPEKRELLTNYLADLRANGSAQLISTRMAAINASPEEPLTKYIATLSDATKMR